jgi:hypothetical protein
LSVSPDGTLMSVSPNVPSSFRTTSTSIVSGGAVDPGNARRRSWATTRPSEVDSQRNGMPSVKGSEKLRTKLPSVR